MTKLNKMLTEVNNIITIKNGVNFKVHSIDELKWDSASISFNYPNSETELRVVLFSVNHEGTIFTSEHNATIVANDVRKFSYC